MDTPPSPPPVPATQRLDGWTAERQREFLQALIDTGSLSEAVRRVGMSRQSAYAMRRHPDAGQFRQAWDMAMAEAWRRVEESVMERVIHGETEVYERDDVRIVRHKPCSPRLVALVMDRAARARAQAQARFEAEAKRHHTRAVNELRAQINRLAHHRNGDMSHEFADRRPTPTAESLALENFEGLLEELLSPEDIAKLPPHHDLNAPANPEHFDDPRTPEYWARVSNDSWRPPDV
ncbi:hypothetical protein [Novosphingobium sp. PASSN1]|uniref:hypothetical protein n=1 Tax=Novosphingobium sp. PASSN1 TaxID=2015561 RepID=UPI000BDBC615|nr:hypothetical protein [Novosphingobium sp. PASSN1]OYU34226.1 MAG: hypothetical protein CFE35_16585 [Novosphingobium sp. PASSN1]